MHAPDHDPDYPEYPTGEELRYRRPVEEPAPARPPLPASPLRRALRGPRGRALVAGAAALLILLVVGVVWYTNPVNRARRELAQANGRILEKQREVDDARRLLERRLAELRAARADADVYATVYRGVLEREGRAGQGPAAALDAPASAAGEVTLPPVAPPDPPARARP